MGESAGLDPVPFGMTYVCDRWPDYIAIMTVGPAICVYGSWATDHGWSLYGLPWGICSYTFYINTIVDFPQGRYEYGNRRTHLGVYPPVFDTTPFMSMPTTYCRSAQHRRNGI